MLILFEDRSASPRPVASYADPQIVVIAVILGARVFSILLAMYRLRSDLLVLLVVVLAEAQCAMMRVVREDHASEYFHDLSVKASRHQTP